MTAEKTGYCYDTVLRTVDRLEEVVEHTYGELADGSVISYRNLKNQPFSKSAVDREAKRERCPTRQRFQEEREQLPYWRKRTGTGR